MGAEKQAQVAIIVANRLLPSPTLHISTPSFVSFASYSTAVSDHKSGLKANDAENPRDWTTTKRLIVGSFVLLTSFAATLGTPIYVPGIPGIQRHLEIADTTLAIAPDTLYAAGLAFGALIGTAACEIYGRRIIYRVSLPLSLIFTCLGATSSTFFLLAISRALSGLFSGPSLTVSAGIINDLWDVKLEKMGTAFIVLFASSCVWATQAGPMIGVSVVRYYGWEGTFWLSAILSGIGTFWSFFIPETYFPRILRKRGEEVEKRGSALRLFLVAVGRPLHMTLVEPLIFPTCLVMAATQSIVFAFYINYATMYQSVYHFTEYQVGMTFGALLVGSIICIPVLGLFDKYTYQKARNEALKMGKAIAPEMRLYPAMLGSITMPISLFWLAWTGRPSIHWIIPTLSGILFGFSYMLNIMCLPVYNNDVYGTRYGASVLATSTFIRFLISSTFLLFTDKMVSRLGFAWATSLLGFITVAMIPVPWVFFKWGPELRKRSWYLRKDLGREDEWGKGKIFSEDEFKSISVAGSGGRCPMCGKCRG